MLLVLGFRILGSGIEFRLQALEFTFGFRFQG